MDRGSSRVKLELSDKAYADLLEIWVYNAEYYTIEHADKYWAFVFTELERVVDHPLLVGRPVENFPHLRCVIIKRRAGGHGHAAYYEIHPDAIRVVRILHTSMYAPDHLDPAE